MAIIFPLIINNTLGADTLDYVNIQLLSNFHPLLLNPFMILT